MPIWKTLITLILVMLLATAYQPTIAAPRIAPIVSGYKLLGGVEKGRWIDAVTTAKQLRGRERYRLYTTAGLIGATRGTIPDPGMFCYDTQIVRFNPQPKVSEFVAFGGTHNPLPRKPRLHNPNTPVYRHAVADILRAHGIANPDVQITKIARIDLEGDGVDEVILNATRITSFVPPGGAGDYSFVMLRKIISGKVETIPIAEYYNPQATQFSNSVTFTVPAIGDFNGDGRLEIIVNSSYFESSGAAIYTVQGSKVTAVLGGGCGP